jgi:cytochrome c biogenesis protein CcdA
VRAAARAELRHVHHGLSFEDAARARRHALTHALLFVLGFTIVFVLLGAGATTLGRCSPRTAT